MTTLLLCIACALGAFIGGVLVGALACGALVFRALWHLGQAKVTGTLAQQGATVLSGRVETEQAQAKTPAMTSTWHPGAETN
jgi:hypothetical protein